MANFAHPTLYLQQLLYRLIPLLALLFVPAAQAIEWPQEISAPEGTIVVYQPQPESLQGDTLKARAAISLEMKDGGEPIFGAMWFEARLDTDRASGIATVRDIKVSKVGWPDSKDAGEQRFTAIIESAVPENGFAISLERLTASLATAEVEEKSLEELKTEPPAIEFSEQLAVLLIYDGKPHFSKVENSPYERALNTPFLVAHNTQSGNYYLGSGKWWYQAKDALGPWVPATSPPQDLVSLIDAPTDAEESTAKTPPQVVVATRPTELIATDGKPDWQSLPGAELLYVKNTETPWIRQLSTGNMYVLLSGRWYRAKSQDGPWTFVRADELPEGFKDIPPASDLGGTRVSVAGTEEAEEAMLDASIPQTAAIKREGTNLQIEYDGEPKFEHIKGTDVAYAVNTGAQVLKIENRYYAVDNGVWFESDQATGPWIVADTVPEEQIAKIPPSSPVYNVTHVHIYEATPEVVYVGYTPGYMWSFPYYGVPVYGTGWYYPPYFGSFYYPRPPTWGFHVGYNPWTGWNFGVSWSNGFFNFGMSWGGGWGGAYRPWGCCGGWYGGGYRGPVVINTGDINIGNNINIGNQTNIRNRIDQHNHNLKGQTLQGRNLYQQGGNSQRLASSDAVGRLKEARPVDNRENNVFADRNGTIARRSGDTWQTRENGTWRNSDSFETAQDKVAGMSESERQQARDNIQGSVSQAQDRVSGMSEQQRQQAMQNARDRGQQYSQQHQVQQRPQIDRSGLNRDYRARNLGATREMRRPQMGGLRRR
ncbi:hypothetical protein GCM10027297_13920 [Parahaliea aestuarii]